MSTPHGHKIKIEGMYRQVAVTADSNGELPTRIEIMRTGEWPAASNKGPLVETVASLTEYKRNYDAGLSQSKDQNGDFVGLPIDFMHEDWDAAAAWIKGMEVAPSSTPDLPADEGGMALYATPVEWTTKGAEAVAGGMFKCFSPSWYPASRGDWTDPEDPNITARNVIVGGGLTNIPFFKGLTSLTASNASNQDGKINNQDNVIYIKADAKEQSMTIDEIRVKEASALSADERTFLEAHKSELSAEELTKFSLEATKKIETKKEEPVADPELEAITASIKTGESVVVKASVFNQLQADVKAMKEKEVGSEVDKHIARGAIKADQKQNWIELIVSNPAMQETLAALPDNSLMADTIGQANVEEKTRQEAEAELHEKVVAARRDEQEKYKGQSYSQVRASILKENKELAEAINGGNQ